MADGYAVDLDALHRAAQGVRWPPRGPADRGATYRPAERRPVEDSPPPELTDDDGAAEILLRGLDDWVSLAEARSLVSLAEPGSPAEVREATLRAMTLLVEHDLARLGELDPRFVPWPLSKEDGLQRVRREWWDPERDLVPGNVVWIDNTPVGDEVARSIEAARRS
ncbi:hypothetical protein [Actinomycetospora aeridis]|uniref:Uncharacterized protein n=1 Tax=Actinomycetospora aeridis TaxID=3129231 RepID=A0ABU8N943_9PSEU